MAESYIDHILQKHISGNGKTILLDKFSSLSPEHLDASYSIGCDLFSKKQYEKAESIFHFLALMNHFEKKYWKALGITLFRQKKYKDSLGIHLAAYFLDPMDIEVTSAMADCCMNLGDKEGALEFLHQTCEIFGEIKKREDIYKRAIGLLEAIERNKS